MRRKHEKGDWKKTEALLKEVKVFAEVVDGLERDRIKAFKKLQGLILEAYNTAPEVDCLFYDSPLSPTRVLYLLKAFSKKCGFEGATDIFVPSIEIKDFKDGVIEGCDWLVKFKNEKVS